MAEHTEETKSMSKAQGVNRLLNSEERAVIEQVAVGKSPWNHRAQALLAVDAGESDIEAGESSGLRTSQVNYWLRKFQQDGMDIFPKEVIPEVDATFAEVPSVEETLSQEKKSSKKAKKSKKAKGKASKDPKKKKGGKKKGGKGKKKKGKKK